MKPFRVAWSSEEIEPVLDRVRAYRFPPSYRGDGWRHGCDADFLRRLCDYWTEVYDWRAAVARLNRFPQFIAEVDGVALHFVHLVGEAEGRRPLLMNHGWPGSHREFWKVAEPLAFPSRHGGRTEDAFDLVIPSLPNFGFSGRPDPAVDPRQAAALFDRLMMEIGYRHYHSHGGDWGAQVTTFLGLDHADHVAGLHMTMLYPYPAASAETHEEKRWAAEMRAMERALCGYAHLQGTRPQSLSWAVGDSPVGQAAWIVERFHDWADLAERPFAAVFSMEDLIDTVMIYVMSGAFNSALRFYSVDIERGLDRLPEGRRVEAPAAFTWFRDPLQPRPPRSYVEKGYRVARWSEMARGGHFPAMEVPGLLVEELRAWARGE
jgi:pimeloyl-ACP methyl ester carboxylesterase